MSSPRTRRTVLCFGDSNTWGFVPGTGARYPMEVRWPGVLRQQLGPDYWVIEEGLNGRTTTRDDRTMPGRNGQQYLRPCLQSHRPLDIVAIYLGLNDLKAQYDATADDIAAGLQVLLEIVAQSGAGIGGEAPRVLVMAPPRLGPLSAYADQFDGTKAYANSARLSAALEAAARRTGCHFLDTATLVTTSTVDGIHLDERAHRTIGLAVSDCIHTMGARPLAGDPDDVTPAS